MMYGVNFNSNIFVNEYWYKKSVVPKLRQSKIGMQYFKRFFYTNNTLSIEHSFLVRKKTNEFFNFRPWIFLHNNWFIFVLNWYKPPKPYKSTHIVSKPMSTRLKNKNIKSSSALKEKLTLNISNYKF